MAFDRATLVWQGYRWLWTVLNTVYPPRCASCQQLGDIICPACQAQIEPLPAGCSRCAHPLASDQTLCWVCHQRPWVLQGVYSWACYQGPLRDALLTLKFSRNLGVGFWLAQHTRAWIRQLPWKVTCVIPIPLSRARERERGYNQVHTFSFWWAMALRVPHLSKHLVRVRETPSQTQLTVEQRWANVEQAFTVRGSLTGHRVLLVDDVLTTGATLNAAARVLYQAGAVQVYGCTVARAILRQQEVSHGL